MIRLALLCAASLLWLAPLAGAAERLRIVEQGASLRQSGDHSPREKVLVDLHGDTVAQRAFIAQLWTKYAAAFPPEHRSFAVPDAAGISVEWEHDGQSLSLFSCHPLFERNGALVVTAQGVESLSGRSRQAVIQKQPEWFQRFRSAFEAVLTKARKFHEPSRT